MSQNVSIRKKAPPPVPVKPHKFPNFKKELENKSIKADENRDLSCTSLKNRAYSLDADILKRSTITSNEETDVVPKQTVKLEHERITERILTKPKSLAHYPVDLDNFQLQARKTVCFSPDTHKEDVTFSLTEVSSIKQSGLDDTLDFSSSEDNILQSTKGQDLKDEFQDLPLPPPPLLVESNDGYNNFFYDSVPPSPTESLMSGMDLLIPPPPPPDNSMSENYESSSDEEFSINDENDDLPLENISKGNQEVDSKIIKSSIETAVTPGVLKKSDFAYGTEDEDSISSDYSNNDEIYVDSDLHNKQLSINNLDKSNLKSVGNIPKICVEELQHKVEGKLKKKEISNNNKITSDNHDNKNQQQADFFHHSLSQNENYEDLFPIGDIDSGRGVSPEFLDIDPRTKNNTLNSKNNSSDIKSLNISNTTSGPLFASNSSQLNETWSSSSISSDSDNDNSESIPKVKVNIREMLLKHMKTLDSDFDDSENLVSSKRSILKDDSSISSDAEVETRLNDVDVCDWTISDVSEWLEIIGLVHLKKVFRDHRINGKMLSDINLQLLDSMAIQSEDDRELILSEIYALQNTADNDLEVSILDALDNATGEDRQKMLSLIQALQTPSAEAYITSFPSQSSSVSPQSVLNVATFSNPVPDIIEKKLPVNIENRDIKDDKVPCEKKLTVWTGLDEKTNKKKKKRKGFFASFRWKREKKPKSAIVEASLSMLLQASPQGMIKLFYRTSSDCKIYDVNLLISLITTSCEVCKMSLEALDLLEDYKTFFILICRKDGKDENIILGPEECPLMIQCKWQDMITYQFELKQNIDGYITINKEDIDQQEMVTVRLGVSFSTNSTDILPVLLKKFKEKEKPSSYKLQLFDEGNFIMDTICLLSLPLQGHKFHSFKLVNISGEIKEKELKHTELNELRAKTLSLEKQMTTLTANNTEINAANLKLSNQKQELQALVEQLQEEMRLKNIEIKKLQDKVAEKTSQLTSENNEKAENHSFRQKINEQRVHLEHNEERIQSLKEAKETLEKELISLQEKFSFIEHSNAELSEQCKELEQVCKSRKEADNNNNRQIEKLAIENKECLKIIKILEEKLNEAEYKCSQFLNQENESTEYEDILTQNEALEHSNIEKDSKILELEYSIQKKEREFREMEDQLEDEVRKRKRENEQREDLEKNKQDLQTKVEELKKQMNEKEKLLLSMKNQMIKREKKLTKQRTMTEMEKSGKEDLFQEVKRQHQEQQLVLEAKVESLQKQLVEKALSNKKYEFACSKEKEALEVLVKDLERKLSAKDVIIERLESKVAKHDMTVVAKIQDQNELVKSKEEQIHILELEYARMENEYAGNLRESTNAIRLKDATIVKLEAKIKKLEQSNRENGVKIEKYLADKNKLLHQVTADREKDLKDWKNRQREWEEKLAEKDRNLKELTQKQSEMQVIFENRAKKREKEYKKQKYLLEQILEMVNLKAPSLLIDLQSYVVPDRKASVGNKNISSSAIKDEWC